MNTDDHSSFVTVTSGISGYFAVQVWWNPDLGGFWEPYQTGFGRYETKAEAVIEAKAWAESDELRYEA